MTTDGYAAGLFGMLELSMTPFRYYQAPPVDLKHPNHLTYFHDGTISEEKNQPPEHFADFLCKTGPDPLV
jgi:hypothetical protein